MDEGYSLVIDRYSSFKLIGMNIDYIESISKIPEIKKLQAQIDNLEMQIYDYQQIVKELSDKLKLLKKFV